MKKVKIFLNKNFVFIYIILSAFIFALYSRLDGIKPIFFLFFYPIGLIAGPLGTLISSLIGLIVLYLIK